MGRMVRGMSLQWKVFFVIIVLFFLSFAIVKSVPTAAGEPLTMVMEATGAQVEEFSINAWVKLPNQQWNEDELTGILEEVMGELGIAPLDYQLTRLEKSNTRTLQAEAVSPNFYALAVIKVLPGEQYLVVTIEEKARGNHSVGYMQGEIQRITQKFGSSPHISACLIGWLNGTLRDGKQHDLLKKAFRVIDGKIIDTLAAEQFISYTGFAPGIVECIQVGDRKINLNMAMRYSQYDNRTYVTIGSPIITREY